MPAPVRYIDTKDQLREMIDQCLKQKVISVDTEFARTNTYYPMVGLIQLYDGEICYLVDPLAIADMAPMRELLTNENIIKVFHSCSEDMEVFQYSMGVVPSPVFDSQIAAAALGIGFSVSYQNLVEHYLGIVVPKDETRSDWLQRPLTKGQLDYAALDVIYLLQVYQLQKEKLLSQGRSEWVAEECSQLAVDMPINVLPEDYWLKIKGLWKLERKQLSVLKAHCAWREILAREKNLPRNRVVDQKSLLIIARENLSTKHDLKSRAGLSSGQVRKYGDDLLFVAVEARQIPEALCPPEVSRDASKVDSKQLGMLKTLVQEKAAALSIAPELLSKRRYLEKLLRSAADDGNYHLPVEFTGWREEVIGKDLLEALR